MWWWVRDIAAAHAMRGGSMSHQEERGNVTAGGVGRRESDVAPSQKLCDENSSKTRKIESKCMQWRARGGGDHAKSTPRTPLSKADVGLGGGGRYDSAGVRA